MRLSSKKSRHPKRGKVRGVNCLNMKPNCGLVSISTKGLAAGDRGGKIVWSRPVLAKRARDGRQRSCRRRAPDGGFVLKKMESKGDITINLHGPSRFDAAKGAVTVTRRDVRILRLAPVYFCNILRMYASCSSRACTPQLFKSCKQKDFRSIQDPKAFLTRNWWILSLSTTCWASAARLR